MILPRRVPPSSHISYPMGLELAPSLSSPELLASPPTTPPSRAHKHTLSKPMSWLSRSSSSTSGHSIPRAAPKPTRISEPKVRSSIEQLNFHRSGPLGSGATIVRTPQEALSGSPYGFELPVTTEEGVKNDILLHDTEKNEDRLSSSQSSPPLPPLPDISDAEVEARQSVSSTSVPLSDHIPHPRTSSSAESPAPHRSSSRPTLLARPRAPLSDHVLHPRSSSSAFPAPHRSSSRPTLLAHSPTPSRSTPVPAADADPIPSQSSFEAILLSSIPDGAHDPSKLIVTLETCTTTYRTSLRSLISRPSHLSRYITSLLSSFSETASICSNASDPSLTQHTEWFSSVFRDHLASSGFLPQSFIGIHLFLDRPSAPYTHVLAYLRSLPSTPEQPQTLPRAVQLGSTSSASLESLLELRDEAHYLGLAELYTLCCHEINRFHQSALPTSAGVTLHGEAGSVHSFHTLVEPCQPHTDAGARPSEFQVSKSNGGARITKSATRESSSGSSYENKDVLPRGRIKQQGRGIKYETGPPPAGWI